MEIKSYMKFYLTPIFFLLITLACSSSSHADISENYEPFRFEGKPPAKFLEPVELKLEQARERSIEAGEEFDEELYLSTFIGRESLFLNGHILYDDPFTEYVLEVANKLIDDEQLLEEVDIYISSIPIANASAWIDGTIVIYADLLARHENEAQLASLIGHEIAHYTERHQIRKREHRERIEEFDESSDLRNRIAQMQHSRDHEFEADLIAFRKLDRSPYDGSQAIGSLELLEKCLFPIHYGPINFKDDFSAGDYSPDSSKFVDALELMEKHESPSDYYGPDDEELVGLWQQLSSHPGINQRVTTIKETEVEYPEKDAHYLVSRERFEEITLKASFETINELYNQGNYPRTLFESVRLIKDHPDNTFLHRKIASSLYKLAYYQSLEGWDAILPEHDEVAGKYYQALVKFLRTFSSDEMQELAYQNISKFQELSEDDAHLMLKKAKITEMFLSSSHADEAYQEYREKFPDGPHINYVNFKLEE